jgi:hypothetical protein
MKNFTLIALALGLCACQQAPPGVLHPELTPSKGTYEAPAAKVGAAPNPDWSQTTYEASIAGKPLTGKTVTVVGEVLDLSCYWQVGKHGASHRDCAQKCMRAGQPIGLLTRNGTVYVLMDEEHHPRRDGLTTLREKMIEHAAEIIEVTGVLTKVGANQALYVQGFVKK